MKKPTKKIQKNKASYSSDHVPVILEEMHGMMMAFGEGQEVLSDKVDRIQGDVVEIREDIVHMQGDITRMQDDITDIKYKLSDKVDRSEFEKLEKRIIKVERVVLSKRA